jgi:hypothetical protein
VGEPLKRSVMPLGANRESEPILGAVRNMLGRRLLDALSAMWSADNL